MPQEKAPRRVSVGVKIRRFLVVGFLLAVVGSTVFSFINTTGNQMSLSALDDNLRAGRVTNATFSHDGDTAEIILAGDTRTHIVAFPESTADRLYDQFHAAHVDFTTEAQPLSSIAKDIGAWVFGLVAFLLVIAGIKRLREQSRQHRIEFWEVERPDTTFADVHGLPDEVGRAQEIVDMIKNPGNYTRIGAKLPRGALFSGDPGTGKTLLARAIAGEAGLPVYRVAGSELMDAYISRSAEKVRELYKAARSHPGGAIVVIDESDAIGARRTASHSGADKEHNAALTQLLTELDGFDRYNNTVFTILITNLPEALDDALVRPGRLDVQLEFGAPNVRGREATLRFYTRDTPLAGDVDFAALAKQTMGDTGADIELLVNEAALVASRAGAASVSHGHFSEALVTIQEGPQRKGVVVSDKDKRVGGYHEGGHALAAFFQQDMPDPIRVTIVPRAGSGGHTRVAFDEDQLYLHRKQALAQLVWAMAGRAAEKIVCGADNFTSGASDDLEKATKLATQMVCKWGMGTYSSSISLKTWHQGPYAGEVERQVEALLDDAEAAAIDLLLAHLPALEAIVALLLERETIEGAELNQIAEIAPLTEDELRRVREQCRAVIDSVQRTPARGELVPAS